MHLSSLFSLYRNGIREITVTGEILVSNGKETQFTTSTEKLVFPARSLLKPFQFLAAGLPADRWVKDPLYTAALGSISATAEQVARLREIAPHRRKLRSQLAIPSLGFPMDDAHREALKARGESTEPEFHSCFSKHLCILEGCAERGWDLNSYNQMDHPYHSRLRETLSDLLGYPLECDWVVDGCGLPSPVLELSELARLFQRLAAAVPESPLGKIRDKMLADPEWVGGPKRVDTRLMQENAGRVIAKEGADGLLGLAVLPSTEFPEGLGVVVKLYGGYQPFLAGLALHPVLERLGLATVGSVPAGQTIRHHFPDFIRPRALDVSPPVSARTAVFPGDVAYSREVSLNTERGDHLTLSSCRTTLHIGAHADAPSHFLKGGRSIEQVDPELYSGLCEVIEVSPRPNGQLTGAEFKEPRTRRVLFKTSSFPDPEHFNEDFVALSPECVDRLAESGVLLVGVDTPSVDPAASKTLAAHHATAKKGIAILEGIDLREVPEGIYWLQASPLRLEGADASPVRALLTPLNW